MDAQELTKKKGFVNLKIRQMNKTIIVTIIYVIGIIFGAVVIGIWDAETNLSNAMFALIWTAIFLIALFYTDKKSD